MIHGLIATCRRLTVFGAASGLLGGLAACDGSRTISGGNCVLSWQPTAEMLDANPDLLPLRWIHAESIQLGSIASALWLQEGDMPPLIVSRRPG